jgi:EpsI family protein
MTNSGQIWIRFAAAAAMLLGVALFLEAHRQPEPAGSRLPLSEFPMTVGSWTGKDFPLDPAVLKVLGAGEFMVRLYQQPFPRPPVDLFIAYFPSQRAGDTMHSPQNCLPGAGWSPLERDYRKIAYPDGRQVIVNRYLIGKGLDRQLVLYWYQSHGRVIASEYWAKIYLVTDSIRTGRSDGSLVRVTTPLGRSEDALSAEARAAGFAEAILPTLNHHIPEE